MENLSTPAIEVTKYFNRDLSWLSFNRRVLEESLDPQLPLVEKIKFIAIHASNLDEFYRVRVSHLETLSKLGEFNEEENTVLITTYWPQSVKRPVIKPLTCVLFWQLR